MRSSYNTLGAHRLRGAAVAIVGAVSLVACNRDGPVSPMPAKHQVAVDSIASAILAQFPIPAIAVAIVHRTGEPVVAVAGVRKLGSNERVSLSDRWHLGSNTKAITATMIARLVETGRLSWSDTPGQLLPELRDRMSPALRTVTLAQLLSHRAGIVSDTSTEALLAHPTFPGNATAQRLAYASELLQLGPAGAPGTFAYANGDYTIATAMAERVTGTTWEELMRRYVYAPLELDAIVGWPAARGRLGPWGHVDVGGGQLVPHDPNGAERLPVIVGPAGDVSLSIRDYARFLQQHLRGLEGQNGLLRAATVSAMHTDAGGTYGLGWGLTTIAGLPTSYHDGSAGTFYATAAIVPSRDVAIAVIVNAASEAAILGLQTAGVQLLVEGMRK